MSKFRQLLALNLQSVRGLLFVTLLACLSAACAPSPPTVVGKWETMSASGFTRRGSLIEFREDGTANFGSFEARYSWPDNNHLLLEYGPRAQVLYQATLSADELRLELPDSIPTVFKRYQELQPSPTTIAGNWQLSAPSESQCFNGLGLGEDPKQMTFGATNAFSIQQPVTSLSMGLSMNGQFSIQGNRLRISASGTKTVYNLSSGQNQSEPVRGETTCEVTVSHSRLLFKNEQGKTTMYVRVVR